MKQIFSKTFLTIILLSSYAYTFEEETYSFIGMQVASTQYENSDAPTVGFKYGQQNSTWRTAISYNYAQNDDNKFQSLIAQVDRGVLTNMFADFPFKPYLGFSIGVMEQRNSKNAISIDRGYLYGLNGGVNYVFNNNFDLDLGYRYLKTTEMEYIENCSDIMLSLHYYFE